MGVKLTYVLCGRDLGHDIVIIYILTYYMVQSPSWEANWSAASQETPRISRNPKVDYRTHKRPPPVCILGQPNPVHIHTSHPQIYNYLFTFSEIYGLLSAAQTYSSLGLAILKVVYQRIVSLLLRIIRTQRICHTSRKKESISLSLEGLQAAQNKSAAGV